MLFRSVGRLPLWASHGLRTVRDFTNLNEYDFTWEIIKNGKNIATGDFKIDLKPYQEAEVRLELPAIPVDENEYFLNLYAYTKKATDLVPAHYEVAKEQLELKRGNVFTSLPDCSGNLTYKVVDNVLSFESGTVSGKIDLKKGMLFDYMKNGKKG